jgi:hypothetical protein
MSIGTLNLDIRIEECVSCKNLVVRDDSFYVETPEEPILLVTVPGYTTSKVLGFTTESSNIYNSYSFGLSPSTSLVDLPDGLYTMKYAICPHDENIITVYYIRQCIAWCQFDTYLKQSFDSCYDLDDSIKTDLQRIEWLLKGAKAFADGCDPDKAIALHQKAVELLNRIKCRLES